MIARTVRSYLGGALLVVGLTAAAIWFAPGAVDLSGLTFQVHAPDWSVLEDRSPAIRIHLFAALAAFALGLLQLLGPKGTLPHRLIGWVWVAIMFVAAASSIFIREINGGMFSLIHILTGLALVALPMGIYAARRHRVEEHKRAMHGLFFGALIVAGVLAFLPGRTMWAVFFG